MSFTNVNAVGSLFPAFIRGVTNQKPPDTIIQQFIDDIAGVIIAVLERRFSESVQGSFSGVLSAWMYSLGLPNLNIQWQAATVFAAKSVIITDDLPAKVMATVLGGTSGSAIPTWPAIGSTVTDGSGGTTITWLNVGQSNQFRILERGNRYGAAAQLGVVLASYGVRSAQDLAKEYRGADWQPFIDDLNAVDKNGKPRSAGPFDFLFDPNASIASPRPGLVGIAGGDTQYGQTPDQEGISNLIGKFGVDYTRHGGQPPNGGGSW